MDTAIESAASAAAAQNESVAVESPTNYADTTDEAILDSPLGGADAAAAAGGAEPLKTAEAATPVEKPAPEEAPKPGEEQTAEQKAAEAEMDGRFMPDAIKKLLATATPEVRGLMRTVWGQHNAYKQLGTVAELREITGYLPTGVEGLKAVLAEQRNVEEVDAAFLRGGAAGQTKVLEGIHQSHPEAFRTLTGHFPQLWQRLDPNGFNKTFGAMIGATLEKQGMTQALAQAYRLIGDGKMEDAQRSLEALYDKLAPYIPGVPQGGSNGAQPDAREAALLAREQKLDTAEQERTTHEWNTFVDETKVASIEAAVGAIKPVLAELLPKELSDAAAKGDARAQAVLNKKVGEVLNRVNAALKKNAVFMTQYRGLMNSRNRDAALSLVKLAQEKLIRQHAQELAEEFNLPFLAAHRQSTARNREAASRREAGGGSPAARAAQTQPVDYRKMSDQEILDSA